MSILTSDEITKRCQDLVYQVAYAFYDSPYILCLKVLAQLEVCAEKRLADMFMISPNELRKYLGTLHVHRLIKRYVNKERSLQPDWKKGPAQPGQPEAIRTRDVPYWYIDYREFANVTKYRIAIMRKQIDEKVKSEVGQRGYVCTSCSKTYDPLDLSHLFNPSTNTFTCENCGVGELVEFDPATRQDSNINGNGEKQDKMQKFNIATAPIRDALKQIEGITVPSVNILAWIALNVKSLPVPGEEAGKLDPTDKRFQVVIGEDGDEKERLEKARLVEAQRTQNALPVWYTHSTVTGSATTLGLKNAAGPSSSTSAPVDPAQAAKDNEAALAEHYAMMMEHEEDSVKQERDQSNGEALSAPIAVPEAAVPEVKREIVEDDDEDEMEGIVETSTPMVSVTGTSTPALGVEMDKTSDVDKGPMLSVGGIMKPLAEITDEDHEVMTSEEYQAWYDAVEASI